MSSGDRQRERPERGYRLLPHTADVTVSAWAPTSLERVDEAVRGLVAVFAGVPAAVSTRFVPFGCGRDSDGELLVRVLEEVIYLVDTRELVPVRARLSRAPDGGLVGHLEAVALAAVTIVGPAP